MKRKRIINIRKCAATLALLTTTIIAGITNSSAQEVSKVTNINNSKPETSSTIMTDAKQQRLAGGLIIDPTALHPIATKDYFGKNQQWVSVNDVFEERIGPDGNITGRRNHDYKVIKIEEVTTKDGAVEEVKTAECQSCGHIMTLKKTIKEADHNHGTGGGSHGGGGSSSGGSGEDRPVHTHYYGEWVSFNDELEASYCPEDGVLVGTRAHKYNTISTNITSNQNGTHTTTTTEKCTNCNHIKTTEATNDCNYVKTETYKSTDDKHHNHTIEEVCNVCKDSKTILSETENCNFTLTNSKTEINGDVVETYTCTADGCGNSYTKTIPYNPGHTHNWGSWTYLDEDHEQRVCLTDNSHKQTQGHSYGSTYGKEDGEYQTCSSCKHEKKVGDHNWSWEYLDENTEKQVCKNNCGITSDKTQGHHYDYSNGVVNDEQNKITYTCTSCGHSKEAAYSPVHNTHTWGPWDGNSRKCTGCDVVDTHTPSTGTCTGNKEEITCPTCGEKYTITKEHNYEDKYNSSGEYQECSNCHDKTTTTPHSFTYNSSTGRLECACGYNESHSHTSTGDYCTANVIESGHCDLCNQDYKIYGVHLYDDYEEIDGDYKIEHCACGASRKVLNTTNILPKDETNKTEITNPTTAEEIKNGNDLVTEEVVIPVTPDNVGTKGEGSSNASSTETPGNETTITDPEVTLPKEDLGNEAEGENKEDSEKEDEFTPEVAPEAPVTPEASEPKDDVAETMDAGKTEAEAVIEAGNKEVEQVIEAGAKEVDEVMERSAAELQARMEQADAELAAILANSPLQRIRKLF